MFFNPLFLQIANSGESVSHLNTQKMNGSSYLFSDIIKVYVENSETVTDTASTQNLTAASASVLSGFVKRLFSDKLNLDELSVPSAFNKPGNTEDLLLKSTLHFNKDDIHQLISELINRSSNFNGKISLILDETKFSGSVEDLKETPEKLISLLKSGGTLLIEDAELAKENGLLITIVEPDAENSKGEEKGIVNLEVNTSSTTEQPGDYGIKLSLINLAVDNTIYNPHQKVNPGRKINIILNNPPAEYYTSAKLSSKDISELTKMSGDTYKQVPFRSTTTAINYDTPADNISISSQGNNTAGDVQEITNSNAVSNIEIVTQKPISVTEQIKVKDTNFNAIKDHIKAGDSTKEVIELKTNSPSVPYPMNDIKSKYETISGDVNKVLKNEDNKQPYIHSHQKTVELKSGAEITTELSGIDNVSKHTGEKTYTNSENNVNVTTNTKSANVVGDVHPKTNTKIVPDIIKNKDLPLAIQTSPKTKEVSSKKIEEVKNSSGDTKYNSTIPGVIKEIKTYQKKVEAAGKLDSSVSVKNQPQYTSDLYIKEEVSFDHEKDLPESNSNVASSSSIKAAKENIFPAQNSKVTSDGTEPKNVIVRNIIRTDKDIKITQDQKTIVNETTDAQEPEVANRNSLNDQIKTEVIINEKFIAGEIRTAKEKEQPTSQKVKVSPASGKVEFVNEEGKIISSKPDAITGTKTMKDVIAKGLKEINTGNTDQFTLKNTNQTADQLRQPEIKEFVNEKAFIRNEFEQKPDSVKRNEENIDISLQNQETSLSENSQRSDSSFMNRESNERSGFVKEGSSIHLLKSQAENDDKKIPVIDKQNFELKEKKNVSDQPAKFEQETGTIKKEHSETFLRNDVSILTKEKNVSDIPFQQNHSKIIKAAEIVKEMSTFIQDGSKNSIVLKLDPENLGSMKIQLDIVNKMINAQIEVDNEVTQKLVENNLPQLYNTLNQSGVQVNMMNITLNNFDQKNTKNFFSRKRNSGGETERIVEDKSTVQEKNMGYNTYEYLI